MVYVVERPLHLAGRFLSSDVLVAIGKRSYALYLWSYVLNTWFRDTGSFESFLVVGGSFLAAEISYRFVELPALGYKDRFVPQLPARKEDDVATPTAGYSLVTSSSGVWSSAVRARLTPRRVPWSTATTSQAQPARRRRQGRSVGGVERSQRHIGIPRCQTCTPFWIMTPEIVLVVEHGAGIGRRSRGDDVERTPALSKSPMPEGGVIV